MARAIPLPSQARLRHLLDYNPTTGVLRWRYDPRGGMVAGSRQYAHGRPIHIAIVIDGQSYHAHRVIWKWMTGADPVATVDHRNCNPFDNSWSNLREATQTQQMGNRSPNKGKALLKGVRIQHGKFQAGIRIKGKTKHLGYFDTEQEAHDAYVAAAKHYFGPFARAK